MQKQHWNIYNPKNQNAPGLNSNNNYIPSNNKPDISMRVKQVISPVCISVDQGASASNKRQAESLYEIKSGGIDIPDDSMAKEEGEARLIESD